MVESTLVSSTGVKRTYNQFIKADQLATKFKCKRDFIKYFRENCKSTILNFGILFESKLVMITLISA